VATSRLEITKETRFFIGRILYSHRFFLLILLLLDDKTERKEEKSIKENFPQCLLFLNYFFIA
jgi:hypothetical protein